MVNKNLIPRKIRHLRIRKRLKGTKQRPRVSIYRSAKNLFVQFIDDTCGHTLLSVSTLDKDFKNLQQYGGNKKAAGILGELASKKAIEKGIKKVVFDRGGYKYFGRIQTFAESLRKGGLEC